MSHCRGVKVRRGECAVSVTSVGMGVAVIMVCDGDHMTITPMKFWSIVLLSLIKSSRVFGLPSPPNPYLNHLENLSLARFSLRQWRMRGRARLWFN